MQRPWLSAVGKREMNQVWVLPTRTFESNEKMIEGIKLLLCDVLFKRKEYFFQTGSLIKEEEFERNLEK